MIALDLLFIRNYVLLLFGFSPIFAFLFLERMTFLNRYSRILYPVLELGLLEASLALIFVQPFFYTDTVFIVKALYPIFMYCFLSLYERKFPNDFTKSLMISIFLIYILTEIHEVPGFFWGYLGIEPYTSRIYEYHFFTHLYTGVVYGLAVWKIKIPLMRNAILIPIIVLLFLFYAFDPLIDIALFPSFLSYLKRVVCFFTLAYIFEAFP